MREYYVQGFIDKCAAVGIDPEQVVKRAQSASAMTTEQPLRPFTGLTNWLNVRKIEQPATVSTNELTGLKQQRRKMETARQRIGPGAQPFAPGITFKLTPKPAVTNNQQTSVTQQ